MFLQYALPAAVRPKSGTGQDGRGHGIGLSLCPISGMDSVVHQIHTLSTQNESDLKKLKDFLRHEQETLKANAPQIDQALQALDPVQCTLGVAYLLQAQLSAAVFSNQRATFAFICNFLQVADGLQAKKAASPMTAVCRSFSQMAIELGQQAMLKSLKPLRSALEKLQDTPETLTPVHSEFLRVCLKVKVYHLAARLLDQPIFDISASNSTGNSSPAQLTPQSLEGSFGTGMVRPSSLGFAMETAAEKVVLSLEFAAKELVLQRSVATGPSVIEAPLLVLCAMDFAPELLAPPPQAPSSAVSFAGRGKALLFEAESGGGARVPRVRPFWVLLATAGPEEQLEVHASVCFDVAPEVARACARAKRKGQSHAFHRTSAELVSTSTEQVVAVLQCAIRVSCLRGSLAVVPDIQVVSADEAEGCEDIEVRSSPVPPRPEQRSRGVEVETTPGHLRGPGLDETWYAGPIEIQTLQEPSKPAGDREEAAAESADPEALSALTLASQMTRELLELSETGQNGTREFLKALQLLLVVLTCPATCLSAIQADAYKKYVLLCLKVHGEVKLLPIYTSHILVRYSKSPSYVLDIAEAFKASDIAGLQRIIEEKQPAIEADQNLGLVKQVLSAMRRHKILTLTKTYLTLSLAEIASEAGIQGDHAEAEAILFDMISENEIQARIDQRTGNVSFEDAENLDMDMMQTLQGKLGQIMELSQRISGFEQEVVTSESYVRKTSLLDMSAERQAGAMSYDLMDM
ncbi:cops3 [Symbiodinium sp. CCMP2592]|nr:cops3 [Symbiodinium sp. CCMP2592]